MTIQNISLIAVASNGEAVLTSTYEVLSGERQRTFTHDDRRVLLDALDTQRRRLERERTFAAGRYASVLNSGMVLSREYLDSLSERLLYLDDDLTRLDDMIEALS